MRLHLKKTVRRIDTAPILRWVTIIATVAMSWLSASNAAEWAPAPDTRIINFSGHDWFVKDSAGEAVGPGPNLFAADNVEVQDGQLHLRISQRGGRWTSAEIVSTASFGYGRYSFAIGSEVSDLDPNIVLGLFTWSGDPAFSHREIDIEISRWGSPTNDNTQCVVQPFEMAGAIVRFEVPAALPHPVYTFTWTPDSVTCEIGGDSGISDKDGSSPFRFEHRFTKGAPVPGGENARINFWQLGGQSPLGNQPQEVVISSFKFTPLSN